jgi:hypothetical protein
MNEWRSPNSKEIADMVAHAYTLGLNEDHVDENRIDWDGVYRDCETLFDCVDLGSDVDSKTIAAIRTAYRKGRKESMC